MKILQQAELEGLEYVKRAGAASIDELRKIPAEDLPMGMGMGGAWPIVDGYVIPDDQYKLYATGKYNDVPVLIGYNSDEGLSFPSGRTPEEYIEGVERRFGPFAKDLIKVYPPGENSISRSARNLMRDAAFGWHTWSWARLQSKTGNSDVYLYYFDQHPKRIEGTPEFDHGTPHGVDVPFVFMTLDPKNPDTSESDLSISEIMGTYWTNFAKYGHPNSEGIPNWPAFSDDNPAVMHLGPSASIGPVPDESSLKVMDKYFEWRRSEEGKLWAENNVN